MTGEDTATHVRIRGPLPMDVAGTLLTAIGRVYPRTKVATADPYDALHLVIPEGDRPVDAELSEGLPVEVVKLDASGLKLSTPRELAAAMTFVMETAFARDEPENYLETEVHVPASTGHHRYAMVFARSPEQTPHELRMRAERKLTEANSRIAELENQIAAMTGETR